MSSDVQYPGLEQFQVDQPNLTKAEKEELTSRLSRFIKVCLKVKTLKQAERLWNWADCQPEGPAVYYELLVAFHPEWRKSC